MSDILFIHELCVETTIGSSRWERAILQPVYLDVEMAVNVCQASQTDTPQNSCHYSTIANRLIEFVGASQFHFIEELAEACASMILNEFPVMRVKIRINKIQDIPQAKSAGIIIERSKAASSS